MKFKVCLNASLDGDSVRGPLLAGGEASVAGSPRSSARAARVQPHGHWPWPGSRAQEEPKPFFTLRLQLPSSLSLPGQRKDRWILTAPKKGLF